MEVREAKTRQGRRLRGEKARRSSRRCASRSPKSGSRARPSTASRRRPGVSRGLLHYYFGSKERLLVEVIRRDTEYRIDTLGEALRGAATSTS